MSRSAIIQNVDWMPTILTEYPGEGGGGTQVQRGGCTRVTYFPVEGVFFQDLRMSAIL